MTSFATVILKRAIGVEKVKRAIAFAVKVASSHERDLRIASIRRQLKVVGEGVDFKGDAVVTTPKMMIAESNVHIGNNAYFHTDGGLYIGENTHISRNVTIYTTNHAWQGARLPYDEKMVDRPVIIGRNVWIGMNVSICPGARIGDGAVIGLGSVVAGEVPAGAVYVSEKGRVVGQRDPNHYRRLDDDRSYGGSGGTRTEVEETYKVSILGSGSTPLFILSAGRSGSKAIAETLSQHSQVTAYHEPNPQLIRLSADYAYGMVDDDAAIEELTCIYRNTHQPGQGVYCESDQNLFNLSHLLLQIAPKSRFLHLIRDGREFVASAMHRQWFSEKDLNDCLYSEPLDSRWSWYRLRGSRTGDFSKEVWERLSQFEKCCWYWKYVNEAIEDFGIAVKSKSAFHTVRLHELEGRIDEIVDFLGLPRETIPCMHTNRARDGRPISSESWGDEQHKIFESYCAPLMDRYFEGWRTPQRNVHATC